MNILCHNKTQIFIRFLYTSCYVRSHNWLKMEARFAVEILYIRTKPFGLTTSYFILFLFQLDTLIFSFFTFTVFLYMFWTDWSIIRRIKCFITQAATGTVPCNMSFSNCIRYLVCCTAFVIVFKMSEFVGMVLH